MVDQKTSVNTLNLIEDIHKVLEDNNASYVENLSAISIVLLSLMDLKSNFDRSEETCLLAKKTFHKLYMLWKNGPPKE